MSSTSPYLIVIANHSEPQSKLTRMTYTLKKQHDMSNKFDHKLSKRVRFARWPIYCNESATLKQQNAEIKANKASELPSSKSNENAASASRDGGFACKSSKPKGKVGLECNLAAKASPMQQLHAEIASPRQIRQPHMESRIVSRMYAIFPNDETDQAIFASDKTVMGPHHPDLSGLVLQVELVQRNEDKDTPRVVLTASEAECPTMSLQTWKDMGGPLYGAAQVFVCTRKVIRDRTRNASPNLNKHSSLCVCSRCCAVAWKDGLAKSMLFISEEDGVGHKRLESGVNRGDYAREGRVWWSTEFSEGVSKGTKDPRLTVQENSDGDDSSPASSMMGQRLETPLYSMPAGIM